MTIQVTCDGCFRSYSVKDELAGRRIKCPDCGGVVEIPDGRPQRPRPGDGFGDGFGVDSDRDSFRDHFAAPPAQRSRTIRRSTSAVEHSSGVLSIPVAVVGGGVALFAVLVCGGAIGIMAFFNNGASILSAERDRQLVQALALRQVGETREETGSLSWTDETLESGEYFDEYTFTASHGDVFVIDLYSDDFDSYLLLRDETIDGGFQLDNDDAGTAEDTGHAQIIFSAPRGGTFYAIPTSYEPGETGRYLLTIREVAGSGAGGPVREESGSLAPGDDQLVESQNEYRDLYTLSADVGDLFVIDLTSTQFDPWLFVEGPKGSGLEIHNDDYESASRSRITMLAPESGDYSISVTSYEGGETGSYHLTIREL